MKFLVLFLVVCATSGSYAAEALADNPFGVFDFNLRGANPGEQIHSLDGIGFAGLTMPLNRPADLTRLAGYRAAKPDLILIAGYLAIDPQKKTAMPDEHIRAVVSTLAELKARLWLIISGPKDHPETTLTTIRHVADLAAEQHVELCLYPHDNSAIESAEEALALIKRADRPGLTLTVHLCHEIRAGNGDRLAEVVQAVRPYLAMATISGADRTFTKGSKNWSDSIKPLNQGDFDSSRLLLALAQADYHGPIILHTFGLMNEPATHYRESFATYQRLRQGLTP